MLIWLQYIGTLILILHKFPQLYRAYKERHRLRGLSIVKLTLGIIGGVCMGLWAIGSSNWGIVVLNIFHTTCEVIVFTLVYRCNKNRKKEKEDQGKV